MARPSSGKPMRAKVFWSGTSQAVRLPKAFRFSSSEVSIRRDGDAVVLEPLEGRRWPPGYWERFGPLGDDFRAPEPLPSSPHRDETVREL
jgi:antitoxin VapB